jgi:adenosine deaminase
METHRSKLSSDLADLPKCELHVHLEGSVSRRTADQLARREGISLAWDFGDMDSFIETFSRF